MEKKIIFKGKTYVLESENVSPLSKEEEDLLPEEFMQDELVSEPVITDKEQEVNDEFAQADNNKAETEELKGSLSDRIDHFYQVVGRYTTEQEMRRIIRVVYEIVAKRFLDAKRIGDESAVEEWKMLIKKTPSLFITEGFDDSVMNRLAMHFNSEIESPEDAMAFIMAISRRLNELASEQVDSEGEMSNTFDELKEDFDEHLQQILAV